mgnify:FL=1
MESVKKEMKNTPLRLYKQPGAVMITAAIVLVGALLGLMLLVPKGERIKAGQYQVVYTTSGQAYFGKLQNTGGDYLVLKSPYTAQEVKGTDEKSQPQTTLVKVSQQAYGPEDVMSLKSEQVLFWQNLRPDSKVAKAIESKQ